MEGGGSNRAKPDIEQEWDSKQEESMVNRCGWYLDWRIHWPLEDEEKVRKRVLIFRREERLTRVGKDWKMQIEKAQHPTTE
jgi:hypothetical protein